MLKLIHGYTTTHFGTVSSAEGYQSISVDTGMGGNVRGTSTKKTAVRLDMDGGAKWNSRLQNDYTQGDRVALIYHRSLSEKGMLGAEVNITTREYITKKFYPSSNLIWLLYALVIVPLILVGIPFALEDAGQVELTGVATLISMVALVYLLSRRIHRKMKLKSACKKVLREN